MFYFHPLFWEDLHFDYYFSIGLKPPTSIRLPNMIQNKRVESIRKAEFFRVDKYNYGVLTKAGCLHTYDVRAVAAP